MSRRRRPGVVVALVTLAVALTGVAATAVREHARQRAATVAALTESIAALAPSAPVLFTESVESADAEIRRWAAASGLRVTLINPDGVVVADSWTLPELLGRLENHRARPEVTAAAAGEVGVGTRLSITTDHPYVYVARLVGPPGNPAGFLRLAREQLPFRIPWGLVLAACTTALAASVAAQSWEGHRHRRLASHLAGWTDLDSDAEPAALAEEADRHFRTEREALTRELEVVRAALAEVEEGVVLLDTELAVRFANPAAVALLGRELAVGRPLVEAVRAPELLAAVGQAKEGGVATHTSITGAGDVELAVRACALPHAVLSSAVVLRDTRGERALERARRALVADLAHELRTPLTVLAGLAEELAGENTPSDLVASLERQVQRLQAFAEELEELAAIEAGQVPLHIEPTPVAAAVRQVLADLRPAAEQARVTLEATGADVEIATDPVRFAQIVTNLVDNAIRYNRPGGRVGVAVEDTGGGVRVRVEDTGIGIPAADLPLVFQRFYRVRRGAERRGGSGLGLAIVKHLVRALGGTIQLTSREGEGTEVTLTFPRAPAR